MSEFLAIDRQLEGEAATVEGRLADILAADDCAVEIDEYKLSKSDKARVVAALRLAASPPPVASAERPTEEMVLAGADVLLTACSSDKGQLHPWKPFDMAQVAIKVWTAMSALSGALEHPGAVERNTVIEECAKICERAALRCVREGTPGDSVATFCAQQVRLLRATPAQAPASEPTIPAGIYYSVESMNFYNLETKRGCGLLFYNIWKDRWREFPQCAPAAEQVTAVLIPHPACKSHGMPLPCTICEHFDRATPADQVAVKALEEALDIARQERKYVTNSGDFVDYFAGYDDAAQVALSTIRGRK